MRASARVALVSLIIATGGLAGCSFSLNGLSDAPSEGLVSPEDARITPGEETSEPSAKEGASGTQTADTPSERKDKPAQKAQRLRTAKAKKPAAPARAAAAQPQTPEPKSVPVQGEPLQHPWPNAPAAGNFSR
jgi:hypothetical protein